MAKATHEQRNYELDIFIIACALIAAAIFLPPWIWKQWHSEIAAIYGHVRYVQLWIFQALADHFPVEEWPGFSQIGAWIQILCQPTDAFSLCTRDFQQVEWQDISDSSFLINQILFVFFVAISLAYVIHVYRTHPSQRFNRIHTYTSFIKESQALYPHLRIFSAVNMIDKPLDDQIWGMSLTSRQFAKKYHLIAGWSLEERIKDENGVYVQTYRPTLDREKARTVFAQQAGESWSMDATAIDKLSVGETLLMAIAMPRVAATDVAMSDAAFDVAMRTSNEVITWCWDNFDVTTPDSTDWMHPKIDLTYPRAVINKYITHPAVKSVLARHAYCRTVIIALILKARRLGVLAPCEMRWLRFYDRELWYVLQSIGRRVAFAEGATAYALYLLEVRTGEPATHRYIDHAIDALDAAVSSYRYVENDAKSYGVELTKFS